MLTKNSLLHLLDALESADSEFNELVREREWYVTAVTDKLTSAIEIVRSELAELKQKETIYHGTQRRRTRRTNNSTSGS